LPQSLRKTAVAQWYLETGMSLDVERLFAEREAERYALHARYLNEQMVRVLKTIGFDQAYRRGQGQYLYDRDNRQYLDHWNRHYHIK
jgi:ornithine--oxo-acid transaminase